MKTNLLLVPLWLLSSCDCPRSSDDCPSYCDEVVALRVDLESECIGDEEVIGCWEAPDTETTDLACLQRVSDGGVFYFTSGTPARHVETGGAFIECGSEARSIAFSAEQCK
jgi:hypothetical protein